MRYDTKAIFISKGNKHYDPDLGQHVSDETKEERMVNVSSMGFDRQQLVFGNLVTGRTVIATKQPYKQSFDYIEINGQRYKKVSSQPLRHSSTFIVEKSYE